MFQQLFIQMYETIELLNNELNTTNDLDKELSLLERYLSIKELSEELTYEIKKLQFKLHQFEAEHGLLDLHNDSDKEEKKQPEGQFIGTEEEVIIELDEDDFFAFQKGIGFYDLFMYDQAIVQLEKIIKKYPDFNLARIYTAMTYFKKKKYSEAKREVYILLKLSDDPDLLSLGNNILGMVYSHELDYESAMKYFQEAIQLKKNWNEPKFNLAMIYYKLGQLNESITLLEDLYRVNPQDWEVLFYLGKAYQKQKNPELAGEYFRQTYSISKQPIVTKQIANHFESRRNFSQAVAWYKKWLELEPFSTEALLGLAKNEWLSNQKDKGINYVKKLLTIDRNHVEGALLYAWMLTDKEDSEGALRLVEKLIKNTELELNDSYLVANMARLFYLNNDSKMANQFCRTLLQSKEDSIRSFGHIVQGLIHLDQNQPDEALLHFEKVNVRTNHFPYLDFYLGYTNYLLGRLDDAKRYWGKMIL